MHNLFEAKIGDYLPGYMKAEIRDFEAEYGVDILSLEEPADTSGIPDMVVSLGSTDAKAVDSLVRENFLSGLSSSIRKSAMFKLFSDRTPLSRFLLASLGKGLPSVGDDRSVVGFAGGAYGKGYAIPDSGGLDISKGQYSFSGNRTGLGKLGKWLKGKGYGAESDRIAKAMQSKETEGLRQAILRSSGNLPDGGGAYYLKVSGRPDDKLRMSISDYYSSCQNLYSGGSKDRLPAAMLDGNSKMVYIISDEPYIDQMGNRHPFMPIARAIVRRGGNGGYMMEPSYPSGYDDLIMGLFRDASALDIMQSASEDFDFDLMPDIKVPPIYSDRMGVGGSGDLEDHSEPVGDNGIGRVASAFKLYVGPYYGYDHREDDTVIITDRNMDDYTLVTMRGLFKYVLSRDNKSLRELLKYYFGDIPISVLAKYGDLPDKGGFYYAVDNFIADYGAERGMLNRLASAIMAFADADTVNFIEYVNGGDDEEDVYEDGAREVKIANFRKGLFFVRLDHP